MNSIKTTRDRLVVGQGYNQARFHIEDATDAARVYEGQTYVSGKAVGIFDPDGGGVPRQKVPTDWLASSTYAAYGDVLSWVLRDMTIGSIALGTAAPDETVILRYLSKEICEELNLKLKSSKAISDYAWSGGNGTAYQYIYNSNLNMTAIATSGDGGITLPSDMPICMSEPSSSPVIYQLFYEIASH